MSAAEVVAPAPPNLARSSGQLAARRRLATLRILQHGLGQCFGARVGRWLARAAGFGFVSMALYTSVLAADAVDAVLRMALLALSACAGLGAVSAAGPGLERTLEAGRGLLESRALSLAGLKPLRALGVALWIVREIGIVVLVVALACVALTPDPGEVWHSLGLGLGALAYLLLLAGGLALLAELCHTLGRTRGQTLFWALILLPEVLAPAWPELPSVRTSYVQLLDRCLGLESSR